MTYQDFMDKMEQFDFEDYTRTAMMIYRGKHYDKDGAIRAAKGLASCLQAEAAVIRHLIEELEKDDE